MQKTQFVRDIKTDALINIDDTEYRKIIADRQKIKQERYILDQINNINAELKEIRRTLSNLMDRNT